MSSYFYLMNKDNVVAVLSSTMIQSCPVHILEVNKSLSYIDNLFFLRDDNILNSWIDNRRSPLHRKYMDSLYKAVSIDSNYRYIVISKCLSLNDTFWVKSSTDNLTWKDVSPYSNSFSKVLSEIAYGLRVFDGHTFISPSPELSTNGVSQKCWKRQNGNIYLYKSGGGLNELEFSQAYSEFFASQVAYALGLNSYIHYDLANLKGVISAKSKLFTSEQMGYVPIGHLFSSSGYVYDDVNILKSLPNSEINLSLYRQMLVFDSLIFNPDRHIGNYGFLIDNNTYELLCLAPVFDNDRSLLYGKSLVNRDSQYINDAIREFSPKTCKSYLEQSNLCMTESLYNSLKVISNDFELENHKLYPCSSERVKTLSSIIRWRAGVLIKSYDRYYLNNRKML